MSLPSTLEPGSLPWLLCVTQQAFDPRDLDPERSDGLDKLRRILRPLDFSEDVRQSAAGFIEGTRAWLLKEVSLWLKARDSAAPRAMALLMGPGLGKTSFMAQLLLKRKDVVAAKFFCR